MNFPFPPPRMASPPPLISPEGWPISDSTQVVASPLYGEPYQTRRRVSPVKEASSPKRHATVTGTPGEETIVYYRPDHLTPPLWAIRAYEPGKCKCPLIPSLTELQCNWVFLDVMFFEYAPPAVVYQAAHHTNPILSLEPTLAPRHIVLPFNLLYEPRAIYNEGNFETLCRIYHSTCRVSLAGDILVFYVTVMPPRPWPKTVAGVTPHFMIPPGPSALRTPQAFNVVGDNESVGPDLDCRGLVDWKPLFTFVRDYFETIGVPITEVIYRSDSTLIVLVSRDTDPRKLPRSVANTRCGYVYDDQMGRPSLPQGELLSDTIPGTPDETEYKILRPGVPVASTYPSASPVNFFRGTAGALVKNRLGNAFLTVASYGTPSTGNFLMHHPLPSSPATRIGHQVLEVGHTGIGLVQLHPRRTFVNQTFRSEGIAEGVLLKKLMRILGYQPSMVFIDTPNTGCLEGTISVTSFRRMPGGGCDQTSEDQWVLTVWFYMGQESGRAIPDGACGSAVWTASGDVVGFLRHAPMTGLAKGWAACTAADELIDRGFTLFGGEKEEDESLA